MCKSTEPLHNVRGMFTSSLEPLGSQCRLLSLFSLRKLRHRELRNLPRSHSERAGVRTVGPDPELLNKLLMGVSVCTVWPLAAFTWR